MKSRNAKNAKTTALIGNLGVNGSNKTMLIRRHLELNDFRLPQIEPLNIA